MEQWHTLTCLLLFKEVYSTGCQDRVGLSCRYALVLLEPTSGHTCLLLLCEGLHPSSQDAVQVVVLVRHEEHATAADGGWGCKLEAVALENKIDIVGKLDALPRGHCQQPGSQHKQESAWPVSCLAAKGHDQQLGSLTWTA